MGKMTITQTGIKDLLILEPKVYQDGRGYFFESFQLAELREAGITDEFVQANQSGSVAGVLRGLHFQKQYPQGKLVRCLHGTIYDAVVDLRPESETFGTWFGLELSSENRKMLFVPKRFAHGFAVLSETAEFSYVCTEYYHPEDEGGLIWNDRTLNIPWPLPEGVPPILAEKDQKHPGLQQVMDEVRNYYKR